MAQASLSNSPASNASGMPDTVKSKLNALRLKINMWLLIDGVSRVLIVLAGLLLLWFLLDYTFNFDYYLRMANLAVSIIVLGYLVYQYLIVPFSSRVSDDALILAVEKHFGRELGESLISAVQFSRMTNEIEVQGVSRDLIRATINQGTAAAGRVPFGSVVDKRWLLINVAIFGAAAIILGAYAWGATAFRDEKYADPKVPENQVKVGYSTYSKQLVGIAFDREVLLRNTPWPQDVYFAFNVVAEDNVILMPRGDDFVLQVRVTEDSKYTIDQIKELNINVVGASGRFSEKLQVVRKSQAEAAEVPSASESNDGDENEASGSDDDAATSGSEADEDAADNSITEEASSEEPDEEHTYDESAMGVDHFLFEMKNVLDDFRFQIEASNVRGESQWFEVKLIDRPSVETLTLTTTLPKYAGGADEELPAGAGPHHILAGSTLKIAGTSNKQLSKVVIRGGEQKKTIELDGKKAFSDRLTFGKEFSSGLVSIDLWDTENLLVAGQSEPGPLPSKRPTQFSLRVKADRPPDVVAKLNSISGMVTPQAIVPFDCLINDEFAVTEVKLNYDWKHEENEAEFGEGSFAIESIKDELGNSTIRIKDEEFKLESLNIPVGSGLRFFISAKDNDDINGPNEGKSTEFLLRVVSEAEVREDLIRRQSEIRVEFERLFGQHQDQRTETEVLRAATRDADAMTPQQRRSLLELQKNHKLLETNIGGVARRMEDIAKEMQNNQLDDSESALLQKLQENVIKPMQELAQGDIDKAMKQLDHVRSNAEQPQPRQKALDDAIAQQEQNEEKMSNILKNMAKTEGYQEAVNLFYEIVKEEERLKKLTQEERERLIQEILDGGKPNGEDKEDKTEDEGENPE